MFELPETFEHMWMEKHPAQPGMYKTMKRMGYLPYQLVIAGFLNHQPDYEQKQTSNKNPFF